MKSRMNIKSIVIMATVAIISMFFINMSLAANTAKINVETANLRENADTNGEILELLSRGEEVEVIEKTGDWYKVKARGITGYLRQDLITINGEVVENNTTTQETEQTAENTETTSAEQTTENTEITEAETSNVEETIELGKKIVVENTKLKIVPVINATDIIEVKKDEEVNVTEVINGWACIEVGTTKGWIRKEKLIKEEERVQEVVTPVQEVEQEPTQTVIKTLFVNTTTINLRKEANTTSEIVTQLPVNTAVDVLEEANGWSKVKVSGKEGYILSSLLSTTKQETSRSSTVRTATEETKKEEKKTETTTTQKTETPVSGDNSSVVTYAKQFIGTQYVYGGMSPSGFDCSGFTSYIYKQYGVSLNRTAAGQYSNGVSINRSDLQPGDLVMFGKSGINHVGIYIGGGQIVHAANSSRGVTTDTINSGYYNNNYVGARRVI